jgi:hypothetical protein
VRTYLGRVCRDIVRNVKRSARRWLERIQRLTLLHPTFQKGWDADRRETFQVALNDISTSIVGTILAKCRL